MTVVVAFFCSDGIVIGADSMITPNMGGINVGHHHGQKISVLSGPQLFAFAGDHGQSERVRIMADGSHAMLEKCGHAIDYPIAISTSIVQQFQKTGLGNNIGTNSILAYSHNQTISCCVFEGAMQPRLLDRDHYYVALGSGKLSADPFLRFLTDVFCDGAQPTTAEAIFLAVWTVQHVIDVNPGGVAAPIRIGTYRFGEDGNPSGNLLTSDEIGEHVQAVASAANALREWRHALQVVEDKDIPAQPDAPRG